TDEAPAPSSRTEGRYTNTMRRCSSAFQNHVACSDRLRRRFAPSRTSSLPAVAPAASAPGTPTPPLTSLVRNCRDAEAQVAVPARRRVPAAVRRPAVPAVVAPAAAPAHPDRAIVRTLRILLGAFTIVVFAVPVGTPLPDVAVHVQQAQRVGLAVLADRVGARGLFAILSVAVGKDRIEVGLACAERVGGSLEMEGELRPGLVVFENRPSSASVFPLRFARQAVLHLVFLLLCQRVELLQKIVRILPRDVLHGEVIRVLALHLLLAAAVGAEVRGVLAHDVLVLLLRHLRHAQVEILRYLHLVLFFGAFVEGVAVLLVPGRAHHELASLHSHELHADAVGEPILELRILVLVFGRLVTPAGERRQHDDE